MQDRYGAGRAGAWVPAPKAVLAVLHGKSFPKVVVRGSCAVGLALLGVTSPSNDTWLRNFRLLRQHCCPLAFPFPSN